MTEERTTGDASSRNGDASARGGNDASALDALLAARALVAEVTPLVIDCGRRCGAACCQPDDTRENGMLLFPLEETLCAGMRGARVAADSTLTGGGGLRLVCGGACDRAARPLSCRIFPLAIRLGGEIGAENPTLTVEIDRRARPVCPLARTRESAMSGAFRQAVRQAGERLLADDTQRAFLWRLEALLREYDAVARLFTGGR